MLVADMRFDGLCIRVRILTTRNTATPDFVVVLLFSLNYKEETVGMHDSVGAARRQRLVGTVVRRRSKKVCYYSSPM